MKRWMALLAVWALASRTITAHAESERATVSLTTRFGVATAPFYTANFPSTRGHALVTTLAGTYRVGAHDEVGLALPVAFASIEQPAGAYVDEFARGNPTLFASHNQISELAGGRTLRWFGGLRISLPFAESGAPGALLANRALAIANALDGWCDQESYFPGRLSFTPNAGIALYSRPWTLDASLFLPTLFKVSDANLPEEARARAVGFAPVVHSGVAVQPSKGFIAGLSADLVVNAIAPVEGARSKTSATQFVIRPRLVFPLGRRARLAADFVAPIVGSLGGSTFSGSLHLTTIW